MGNKEQRYVFLHPPKTGGVTFNVNIINSGKTNITMGHDNTFGMYKDAKHILFLREPLGRTISHCNEQGLAKTEEEFLG